MSRQAFLSSLAKELFKDGWGEIFYNYNLEGVYVFDLHAVKKAYGGLSIREIFVKGVPAYLDYARFQKITGLYEALKNRTPSSFKTKVFYLCIFSEAGIAGEVTSVVDRYYTSSILKSLYWSLCLADLRNSVAYMKIPTLPLDLKKTSRRVLDNVNTALSAARQPVQHSTPRARAVLIRCRNCGGLYPQGVMNCPHCGVVAG